jgi:small subunit ribosomal protein S9
MLFEGKGKDMINGKEVSEYVTRTDLFAVLYTALNVTKLKEKFYFNVKISGS